MRRFEGGHFLFRWTIVFSVFVHGALAMAIVWVHQNPPFTRVSFPVMEIKIVNLEQPVSPREVLVKQTPDPSTKTVLVPKVPAKALPKPVDVRPERTRKALREPPLLTALPEVSNVQENPPAITQTPPVAKGVDVPEPVVLVEVRNFKYDYYLHMIQNKIEQRWRQPVSGKDKRAVVQFTIARNGRVKESSIEESSGDDYFDQTVLRAVRMADPFPPLPQGFGEDRLRIHYRFRFGVNG